MSQRFRPGEEGSLPLAMIVAIVLAGAVAVVFSIVMSGVASSGRDRDFASAIQVADAGLQEAYVVLGEVIESDDEFEGVDCDQPDWFDGPNDATHGACVGTLGADSEFDWEYTWDAAEDKYIVHSVGRYRNSARAVQMEVVSVMETQAAIVGDLGAGWSGGGNTLSEGIYVGTFGCFELPASSPEAIAGVYYYGDNLEEHISTCWIPTATAPDYYAGSMDGPDLTRDPAGDACSGMEDEDIHTNVPEEVERGHSYCVRQAAFPPGFNIVGDGVEQEDEELDTTVRIYVYSPASNQDAVLAGTGGPTQTASDVNASGAADDLRVYVSHTSGDALFRPDADVSMHLWAPGSECQIRPGGEFNGTITCEKVVIRGTYSFEADTDGIQDQVPTIQRWTEERVPPHRRDFASG